MNHSTTQAEIFATEYAKNAAQGMLHTIKRITSRAGRITRIALGVSMPHQIGYILALAWPHMRLDTPSAVLETITLVLLAFGVPAATDLLILNCVETIGATAAALSSKRRAMAIMIVPVVASGTVNFLAPAPTLIKVLAAFIVTMIPFGESLRFIRVDFKKIERMETEVVEQITPRQRRLDPQVAAERAAKAAVTREANRLARLTPAQRAAETKRRNAAAPISPGRVPVEELNADMAKA